MYDIFAVSVLQSKFSHSNISLNTATNRNSVGVEVNSLDSVSHYYMCEIAANFVIYQIYYTLSGVWEETADKHRRDYADIFSQIRSVVVAALLDNTLTVLIVSKLNIHRTVELVFQPCS